MTLEGGRVSGVRHGGVSARDRSAVMGVLCVEPSIAAAQYVHLGVDQRRIRVPVQRPIRSPQKPASESNARASEKRRRRRKQYAKRFDSQFRSPLEGELAVEHEDASLRRFGATANFGVQQMLLHQLLGEEVLSARYVSAFELVRISAVYHLIRVDRVFVESVDESGQSVAGDSFEILVLAVFQR